MDLTNGNLVKPVSAGKIEGSVIDNTNGILVNIIGEDSSGGGGTVELPTIGSGTTTEMNALTGMETGDLFLNSTTSTIWKYDGSNWVDTGVGIGVDLSDYYTKAEIDEDLDGIYTSLTTQGDIISELQTDVGNAQGYKLTDNNGYALQVVNSMIDVVGTGTGYYEASSSFVENITGSTGHGTLYVFSTSPETGELRTSVIFHEVEKNELWIFSGYGTGGELVNGEWTQLAGGDYEQSHLTFDISFEDTDTTYPVLNLKNADDDSQIVPTFTSLVGIVEDFNEAYQVELTDVTLPKTYALDYYIKKGGVYELSGMLTCDTPNATLTFELWNGRTMVGTQTYDSGVQNTSQVYASKYHVFEKDAQITFDITGGDGAVVNGFIKLKRVVTTLQENVEPEDIDTSESR